MMKSMRRVASGGGKGWLWAAALVAVLTCTVVTHAQNTPPRQGPPAGVDVSNGFYEAAGALAGATVAGVRAVGRAVKDLVTPGKPIAGLEALREGTVVVVHYPAGSAPASVGTDDSGDGPTIVEGIVSRVERGRKEITVRFGSRTTETFQLLDTGAGPAQGSASPPSDPSAITIDFTDESGQRIARTFRKRT